MVVILLCVVYLRFVMVKSVLCECNKTQWTLCCSELWNMYISWLWLAVCSGTSRCYEYKQMWDAFSHHSWMEWDWG